MDDIDLYIGMTLEQPSQNGALVGDTFLCLIGDQFARLKWGDRYFYDLANQSGSFTLSKIKFKDCLKNRFISEAFNVLTSS